jgi:RHS repeat-associated protein
MTDLAGNVTQIERDASGQATAIVGPYGQRTSLSMDANGFLSAVTNPAHETTSLSNSAGGLLQGITGPRGETYSVAYDNLGRATNVADPLGGGWTDSASDKGVLKDYSYEVDVSCTNSLGDTLSRQMLLEPSGDTYVYYSLDGLPTETAISRLTGDMSSSFSDGTVLYTGMGPDPRFGNQAMQPVLSTLTFPNGVVYSASVQRTVGLTNSTDPFSLSGLTNVTTVNGNSYTRVYNPTNRTLTLTTPEGRTSSWVGDALGRIIHQTALGSPVTDVAYDAAGHLTAITNTSAIGAATMTFSYDGLGRLSTLTDPLGRTNAFGYDPAGRVQQLTTSDGSVASFTQDSEANITSVTPPGRPAHTFQYDPAGLMTKYTPPQVGADESVLYQHDTQRHLTQVTFPDGQAMTLQRGQAGRIDALTAGSGPTITYQYSSVNCLQPAALISSSGDAIQFSYSGSLRTGVAWSGTVTGQVNVQFSTDLLPISQSINGSPIAYGYDHDMRLLQAGGLSITRDPVTGFVIGTSIGNATDARQFDDRGLLTNYTASVNGTAVWTMALSFDTINRITNRVETLGGVTTAFGYVYDLAGRLQQVWQNGLLAASYTYDANGNRLSRNSETATYDAQDRLTTYSGATFAWSPNGTLTGQMVGGQTTSYTYDVRGALLSVTPPGAPQIDYILDPAGHRVGKKVGGNLQRCWLWDDNLPVAELDSNSIVTARFVYAADDRTPSFLVKGTNTYRIFSDERDSARLVVNLADGSIVQQIDYDEFGRVLADTNPGFQPFGFAGGFCDPDSSLVRFGARDYLAQTGQWTGRDPLRFDGRGFNLNAYLGNDPLNQTDPFGTGPGPNTLDLPDFLGGSLRLRRNDIDRIVNASQHGNDNQLQNALNDANSTIQDVTHVTANLVSQTAPLVYQAPFIASTLAEEGLHAVLEEVTEHHLIDDALEKDYEEQLEREQHHGKLHGH